MLILITAPRNLQNFIEINIMFNKIRPIQLPQWSSGHDFRLSIDKARETRVRFVSMATVPKLTISNNHVACWGEFVFCHFYPLRLPYEDEHFRTTKYRDTNEAKQRIT